MKQVAAASAPGKVVLSGEYAVLDGAPAICMAVNRRAKARVENIAGAESRVQAPGYSDVVGRFQMAHDRVTWLAGGEVFKVVGGVLESGVSSPDSALNITLNTDAFIDSESGSKFGIGSSAALTAALCAAVAGTANVRSVTHIAHRHLQGGIGSGVDVACSLHGGLISYRMHETAVPSLDWPAGLQFRLVWTGIASSTVDKLTVFNNGPVKASRAGLAAATESIAATWAEGSSKEIVAAYATYIEQLRAFSVDHKLGIFDAGHESLVERALAANLVYKPCGAGGGDVGVVLGDDETALDSFVADLPANFRVIDCALDITGTRMEQHPG